MQQHHTTPGSRQSGMDEQRAIDIGVEQILTEFVAEIPTITLGGCLTIVAEALPYSLGQVHPLCSRSTTTGDHPITSQVIWKNLETNEVYCTPDCAALETIAKAAEIARDEAIYPAVPASV